MARKITTLPKGIRQLKSGRFQARYSGPDGKRYNSPVTYAYKEDAAAWLATERRLINLEAWTSCLNKRVDHRPISSALGS